MIELQTLKSMIRKQPAVDLINEFSALGVAVKFAPSKAKRKKKLFWVGPEGFENSLWKENNKILYTDAYQNKLLYTSAFEFLRDIVWLFTPVPTDNKTWIRLKKPSKAEIIELKQKNKTFSASDLNADVVLLSGAILRTWLKNPSIKNNQKIFLLPDTRIKAETQKEKFQIFCKQHKIRKELITA